MDPDVTTCGRCGHTMHRTGESASPCCAFPGCDCAEWKRPQCPGSQGGSAPGACPGRPFVGGHDAGCLDSESCATRDRQAEATKPPEGRLPARLSYSIDLAASVVRLVYNGGPSFEEWERTMWAALADPAYRRGFFFLVDRRFDEPTSTDFVRRVVDFLSLNEPELAESRWAIVVSSPASYGMARMKQAFGGGLPMPIEVFRDLGEAEQWLRRDRAV